VGERVDRDPVTGLAGGAPEELPRSLGLVSEGPLEEAEGEPAGFELGLVEGRSAMNRSGVERTPLVAVRKPRWTAARSGQRTPWMAPMPGAMACWPAR
jgi:hypothetical protein